MSVVDAACVCGYGIRVIPVTCDFSLTQGKVRGFGQTRSVASDSKTRKKSSRIPNYLESAFRFSGAMPRDRLGRRPTLLPDFRGQARFRGRIPPLGYALEVYQ